MGLSTLPVRVLLLLMSVVTTMVQSSAFIPRNLFQLEKGIPGKFINKSEDSSVQEPRVVGCAVSPVKERLGLGEVIVFSSPAFPETYSNGTRCGWKLQAEKNAAIKVSCAQFDLGDEEQGECKSFVRIANQRFCGEDGPSDLVVRRKVVGIYFKSSKKFSSGGFLCTAVAISYPYPTAIPPTGGPLPGFMNNMARW